MKEREIRNTPRIFEFSHKQSNAAKLLRAAADKLDEIKGERGECLLCVVYANELDEAGRLSERIEMVTS